MTDTVGPGYLIDTNVLLRLSRRHDPEHQIVVNALDALNKQDFELYFSLQNIAEFWNVCTRPADRNGFGLSIQETSTFLREIEVTMTLLSDTERVYSIWRTLVIANSVRGVQVHDARLAAVMLAHGVTHILTLNRSDFLRFASLQAVHPGQLLAQKQSPE